MRPPVGGNLYAEVVSEKRAAECPLVVVRLIRNSACVCLFDAAGPLEGIACLRVVEQQI